MARLIAYDLLRRYLSDRQQFVGVGGNILQRPRSARIPIRIYSWYVIISMTQTMGAKKTCCLLLIIKHCIQTVSSDSEQMGCLKSSSFSNPAPGPALKSRYSAILLNYYINDSKLIHTSVTSDSCTGIRIKLIDQFKLPITTTTTTSINLLS